MKISIVIPTYNRAALLSRAVASVSPFDSETEIIVVDDGSTDDTMHVVRGLMKQDRRIMLVTLDHNSGVNAARNAGIQHATGEWISFLDSDDEYVPSGFVELVTALKTIRQDIDVVGFMTLREVNGIMEPRGFRVWGELWSTYEPSYRNILFKEYIQGDIHYCVHRSLFTQGYRFAEYVNGFESAFYAKLAKDKKKFLYLNVIVDRRYSGGDTHLSIEPYKRWPRQFAHAYREFVQEHYVALAERPFVLCDFYLRIGKGMLRSFNPGGVIWLMKAFFLRYNASI